MATQSHINVTVDFSLCQDGAYDVRIPIGQPVKQLIGNIIDALKLDVRKEELFAMQVPLKQLILADDDRIAAFPITNGDVLVVLPSTSARTNVS
ncbi:YukD [Fictibacillus macauensis ZFHKF-1]|uniref:YukD n=1 Tax=Fictibacillus macauensis ZFHKF-1 TaxID=1196324 RepID=I8UAD3_9BACL|nr:EsaB/YukD family protein [Fictibacillus macauensis]EIT83773.1 YukD [Fictibacillus macauensis ZFHKF-1]